MQLTQEQLTQASTKIEKITNQMTETYIRHYETEIKFIQEKAKLSLWIIGLSIGMELFILNKIDSHILSNCFLSILFYSIGIIFIVNALTGLLIRLKQTRLLNHLLEIQTYYDYQRSKIIINLEPDSKLLLELINDFTNGKEAEKLMNLVYIEKSEEKNDQLSLEARSFILKSENLPSTLLVIQAILTIVFFISIF